MCFMSGRVSITDGNLLRIERPNKAVAGATEVVECGVHL